MWSDNDGIETFCMLSSLMILAFSKHPLYQHFGLLFSLWVAKGSAWLTWASSWSHEIMTNLAFQISQYVLTCQLPWSLVFWDMISFIIHPSTAPLISSLSGTHSSHFLPTFPAFPPWNHSSFNSHIFAVSSPVRVCSTCFTAHRCRSHMINRVIQSVSQFIDYLSEYGDFKRRGGGMISDWMISCCHLFTASLMHTAKLNIIAKQSK